MLKTVLLMLVLVFGSSVSASALTLDQTMAEKRASARSCSDAAAACSFYCKTKKINCFGDCKSRKSMCLKTGTYPWKNHRDNTGLAKR